MAGQASVSPSMLRNVQASAEGEVSSRAGAQGVVPPVEGVATTPEQVNVRVAAATVGQGAVDSDVEVIGSSRGAGDTPRTGLASRLRVKRSTPPPTEPASRKKKAKKAAAPSSPGIRNCEVYYISSISPYLL